MMRLRVGSWVLGVAILLSLVSRSTHAIGPAFVVVHGGTLQHPIVLRPAIGSLMFLWAAGNFYEHQSAMSLPPGLEGRQFLYYDVFWGRFTPEDVLKPELASQHGRLYLPTKDQAAAVVLTSPVMTSDEPDSVRATAMPVPGQLTDFRSGRVLSPSETSALEAAGVPVK